MAIRFMIDTDNLSMLTGHVELLATYADLVHDFGAEQAKYPHSTLILIDRGLGDPTGLASVFDIEPGALTIAEAVARFDEQHAKGIKFLTNYHDRADIDAVRQAFGDRVYYTWDATLDGTAHIDGNDPLHHPTAIQCLTATDLGYQADGSLVFDDGWHPRPHTGIPPVLRADLNHAISQAAALSSDLHRMAAAIGG